MKDIDAITGQIVAEETSWAPPRQWTAWPLNVHLVPPNDFLTRTEDEDKAFTFRRVERTTPAAELTENISSVILRCAKDKFRERKLNEETQGEQQDAEPVAPKHDTSSHDDEADATKEQQSMDIGDDNYPPNTNRAEPVLKPVVATDDDLSYELMRPSAQAILAKLDQTLSILHNSRMTSVEGLAQHEINALLSQSAAANSSEDEFDQYSFDSIQPSQRRRPRFRSTDQSAPRSRRMSQKSQAEEDDKSEANPSSERKPRKRGRPKAFNKKKGESEREFLIRRAVMQKKRRPDFSDDDEEQDDMRDVKPAVKKEHQDGEREREKQSSPLQEVPYAMESSSNQVTWTHPLDRFNLRDWSDVMGAAALTGGFSPAVIARATQRCANLFGQGMEMRKINENGHVKTKRYVPGGPHVEGQEFDSEDEDEAENTQAEDAEDKGEDTQSEYKPEVKDPPPSLPRGRMPSIELGGEDSPVPSDAESRGRFSTTGLRRSTRISSRSRSRRPPRKQLFYCSHLGCERAARPFDKKYNLQRHLNKVHDGEEGPGAVTKRRATAADGDKFLGGIHRDGFLEPIRVHRGWRGEDSVKRVVPSFHHHQKGESPELELEGDEDGVKMEMEVEDESGAE